MSQGYSARGMYLTLDGTRMAAVRSKGITFNREPIDTTTDDDSGYRELLAEPGQRSANCTVSGVATAAGIAALIALWEGNTNAVVTIVMPDGTIFTSLEDFFLSALEYNGEQTGPVEFTATFQSSGVMSYTTA